jgi:hypothetical protein
MSSINFPSAKHTTPHNIVVLYLCVCVVWVCLHFNRIHHRGVVSSRIRLLSMDTNCCICCCQARFDKENMTKKKLYVSKVSKGKKNKLSTKKIKYIPGFYIFPLTMMRYNSIIFDWRRKLKLSCLDKCN